MLKNLATTALTLACLSTAVQAIDCSTANLTLDDVNTLLKNKAIEIPQGDLITKWNLVLDGNITDDRYGLKVGGQFDTSDPQIKVINHGPKDNNCVYDVILWPTSLVVKVVTLGRLKITQDIVQQKK